MRIKSLSLLIVFIFSITSCNEKKVTTEYYSTGEILKEYQVVNGNKNGFHKEYYRNGNLKAIHYYKNGIKIDSSIYFDESNKIVKKVDLYISKDTTVRKIFFMNGNIESKGKIYKTNKIGKWVYNREDGSIEKEFEFMSINGEQYTNQGRYFNIEGKLLHELGNFYDLNLTSTNIKLKDTVFLSLKYKPLLALNSKSYLCISSKIDSDFGNLNDVKLDTIHFENNIISNYRLLFGTSGIKNIRGFINEYYEKKTNLNDSIVRGDRKLFLEFKINVH